jgi:predicted MPP superfamily phosphohydrolase
MKTNAQSSLAEGLVILHLSDLHFGNKNRFQNHDLTAFGQEFSRAVRMACEEQNWGRPVDLVVISGDISEVAKPKEFADCCTFLKTVVQRLNLNLERTIFVPGNHDFSWAECEIVDALRKIEEFDNAEYERRLTEVKFKHFDKFLQNFYGLTVAQIAGRSPLHAPSGAYLRDFVIDGLPVSFAALNTSEKETHKRFGGELSKEQAQPLINAWMGDVYQDYLKIAVVHHNPLATPPENLRWTEDWLNGKIKDNKLPITVD